SSAGLSMESGSPTSTWPRAPPPSTSAVSTSSKRRIARRSRQVNQQWLRLMGTPPAYTERGRRFDSVLKYLMGGDLPLRLQGMPRHYFRYIAGTRAAEFQEVLRHASTLQVRYRIDPGLGVAEDELNAKVRRIAPAEGARSRSVNPALAELTGRITVPVPAIHE